MAKTETNQIQDLAERIETICYNENDYNMPISDNRWIAAEKPTKRPSKQTRHNTVNNIIECINAPLDEPTAFGRQYLIRDLENKINTRRKNNNNAAAITDCTEKCLEELRAVPYNFSTDRGRELYNLARNVEHLIHSSMEYNASDSILTHCPWIKHYIRKPVTDQTRHIVHNAICESMFHTYESSGDKYNNETAVYYYLQYEIQKYRTPVEGYGVNHDMLDFVQTIMDKFITYFDDPCLEAYIKEMIEYADTVGYRNNKCNKITSAINDYKKKLNHKTSLISALLHLYCINRANGIFRLDTNDFSPIDFYMDDDADITFTAEVPFTDGEPQYPYSLYSPHGLYINVRKCTNSLLFAYVPDRFLKDKNYTYDGKFNNYEIESYYRMSRSLDSFANEVANTTKERLLQTAIEEEKE